MNRPMSIAEAEVPPAGTQPPLISYGLAVQPPFSHKYPVTP